VGMLTQVGTFFEDQKVFKRHVGTFPWCAKNFSLTRESSRLVLIIMIIIIM
jgi:hypothetical protein